MLDFDPVKHEYRWNGARIDSVTQILEDAGVIDYSRIPGQTREMALDRGKAVHAACHYDDEGDLLENEQTEPYMGYVRAWRKFREETQFTHDLIEQRGYNEVYGFAGTLDRRGAARMWKLPVLLDIKSNDAPVWAAYQTAGYASFYPAPRKYIRLAVELHPDGKYRLDVYLPNDWHEHFDIFVSCQKVARAKRLCNPQVARHAA